MNVLDPAAVIAATPAQLAALGPVALGDARRTARVAATMSRPGAAEALARVEEARAARPALVFRTGWVRDPLAVDPSAFIRHASYAGDARYSVRNAAPGWPMVVAYDGFGIGMADWGNWAQVADVVARHHAARVAS
ncbi:hypothetical protein [Micromonospora okii]|uniref:hypothetical protein n=1 Tax=Micromonospora okii TaxID=1182970 RepID=UPI001E443C2F|nr:hypothetical protein [Micromonospora okii]